MISNLIVKRDSVGKLRSWQYEVSGAQYRTIAGVVGGTLSTSSWTVCVGKQGRSDAEQAKSEATALYDQNLDREYRLTESELTSVPTSPMLAQDYKKQKSVKFPVHSQPKLDGIRCKTTRAGGFSRGFQQHLNVEHILEALAPLFAKNSNLEFDGELYNHELHEDFNKITSIVRKQSPNTEQRAEAERLLQYHIYDLPSHKGNFGERTKALASMLNTLKSPSIVFVQTDTADDAASLDQFYGTYLEQGYEGQMVRLDMPYDFDKRSKFLLKRKEFETAEFALLRVEEGIGNWAGFAKRAVFKLPDGRECGAGIRGNQAAALKLLTDVPTWGGKKQVTIRSFKATPDGMPRFPIAVDFHPNGRAD